GRKSECLHETRLRKEEESSQFTGICAGKSLIGASWSKASLEFLLSWKQLEDQLELFRCYYNFVRPHRALKFGGGVRTPAMQVGLTTRRLTLREIFPLAMLLWLSKKVKFPQSTGTLS